MIWADLLRLAISVGCHLFRYPPPFCRKLILQWAGKQPLIIPLGKNMIGAFYQPKLVLTDLSTIDTLPDRELKAGLAEVIKYGLIRDQDFFVWLEANLEKLLAPG